MGRSRDVSEFAARQASLGARDFMTKCVGVAPVAQTSPRGAYSWFACRRSSAAYSSRQRHAAAAAAKTIQRHWRRTRGAFYHILLAMRAEKKEAALEAARLQKEAAAVRDSERRRRLRLRAEYQANPAQFEDNDDAHAVYLAQVGNVSALESTGVAFRARPEALRTALCEAARMGKLDVVEYLIKQAGCSEDCLDPSMRDEIRLREQERTVSKSYVGRRSFAARSRSGSSFAARIRSGSSCISLGGRSVGRRSRSTSPMGSGSPLRNSMSTSHISQSAHGEERRELVS